MKLPQNILNQFKAEGARGGKAKAAKMTEAERKAHSQKMHDALTKEQKTERAMKGVKARLAKRQAKVSRDAKAG